MPLTVHESTFWREVDGKLAIWNRMECDRSLRRIGGGTQPTKFPKHRAPLWEHRIWCDLKELVASPNYQVGKSHCSLGWKHMCRGGTDRRKCRPGITSPVPVQNATVSDGTISTHNGESPGTPGTHVRALLLPWTHPGSGFLFHSRSRPSRCRPGAAELSHFVEKNLRRFLHYVKITFRQFLLSLEVFDAIFWYLLVCCHGLIGCSFGWS